MNSSTLEKMKAMKFAGMQRAFQTSMETRQNEKLTADEFVSYLIDQEWEYRQNRKITASLHRARFRYPASLEEVKLTSSRNLDKNQLLRLTDCSFLNKKENIIITGPTGVGKSYLASAIGHQACSLGYKVMYFNTIKLFTKLKMSKADATYQKEINKIERQDLLILDDFGLQPLDNPARLALLEIIEDRHGRRSTIITSQLPVASWYELFEEKTIADAILDRIVHSSHRIELKGESMRKKSN
jgi:DNA replication protein DnaC